MATHTVVHPKGRDEEAHLAVQITPTIEREYRRRDVFPTLRTEFAQTFVNGGTGVYEVSISQAEAILSDAKEQRGNRLLPRGLPKAFTALVQRLEPALKSAKGLWDDPGHDEAERRILDSSARFSVGQKVLYFPDGEDYGSEVVIAKPYGLYSVLRDEGHYVQTEGTRVDYCYGYVVREPRDERTWFVRPYQLTLDDCRPAHLRLVASRQDSHV